MKKKLVTCGLLLSLFWPTVSVAADELMDITRAAGYEVSDVDRPKSSIVIDAQTGEVLWQDNVDEVRDPASTSKMMTLYLVYEAIAKGEITEDTLITATEKDQATSEIYALSNNKLVAGVDYTVGELITMTIVPSSNSATLMLANYLSNNDPDAFIDRMNAKAQELGMTNTRWNNASGADAASFEGYYQPTRYDNEAVNETTARDLAIMAYNFIKNYPAVLEHTDDYMITVKEGTPYEETLKNYNYSLPGAEYALEGVDGFKTGSSPSAGFNFIGTAKRGDQRLITVVLGTGDWSDQNGERYRHAFANALLEKGYADYEYRKILSAGEQEINGERYKLDQDFYATVAKGQEPTLLVADGQLSVDNGLSTLSPLVADSVAVSPVKKTAVAAAGDVLAPITDKEQWPEWALKFGIWGVPVFLIILVLFLLGKLLRPRRRTVSTSDRESDQGYSRRKARK